MERKYKCLIIEDEPMAAALIEEYIRMDDRLKLIGTQPDSLKASLDIEMKKPDIVFLDVNISGLTGPEMMTLVEHKPQIIITSSCDKQSFNDHGIQIIDFLEKPIDRIQFQKAVYHCIAGIVKREKPHVTKLYPRYGETG